MKFLEIAPTSKRSTTPFRDQQLELTGLSARQIARVLTQHESIQELIDGKKLLNAINLMQMAPKAVAAFIAYGTGHDDEADFGDPEKFVAAQKAAMLLAAEEQIDLCIAIGDVTFGKHANPFVKLAREQWAAWTGASAEPVHKRPPDIRSLSPTLRKELRRSLHSATTPEMFGATPPAKSVAS